MESSLIEQLRLLRRTEPRQKPLSKSVSRLPIFAQIHHAQRTSIFIKESFCLPIVYDARKVGQLLRAIHHQGGRVVEYEEDMQSQEVTWVLVQKGCDIIKVRRLVEGRVRYRSIVDVAYAQDSLRLFKPIDVGKYVIAQHTQHLQHTQNLQHIQHLQHTQHTQHTPLVTEEDRPRIQIAKECIAPVVPKMECDRGINCLRSFRFPTNDRICSELLRFSQIYSGNHDVRNFAYIRAVTIIRSYPFEIHSADQIQPMDGVSRSIKRSIREFLRHGSIHKLEQMALKTNQIALKGLSGVWGVGAAKAKELFQSGITSVEQLQAHPQLLNRSQRLGLKYYWQFRERIPRGKVSQIFSVFKSAFQDEVGGDSLHYVQVAGSYRRQKSSCGDIDIIVSRIDGGVEKQLLPRLVSRLNSSGFLSDNLTEPKPFDGYSPVTYMGVCYFDGSHHRMDIKHFPIAMYPFALLYFTGSDLFNREMRMIAHHMGLILNEKGLSKKERNGQEYIYKGTQIPLFRSEQEIFSFLRLRYSQPKERDI